MGSALGRAWRARRQPTNRAGPRQASCTNSCATTSRRFGGRRRISATARVSPASWSRSFATSYIVAHSAEGSPGFGVRVWVRPARTVLLPRQGLLSELRWAAWAARSPSCSDLGGALNLNVHLHALVVDGVFAKDGESVRFHPSPWLDAADVDEVLATVEAYVSACWPAVAWTRGMMAATRAPHRWHPSIWTRGHNHVPSTYVYWETRSERRAHGDGVSGTPRRGRRRACPRGSPSGQTTACRSRPRTP